MEDDQDHKSRYTSPFEQQKEGNAEVEKGPGPETDHDNVEAISSSVGYEDPASFRRIFKRKVGLTPAVYRRKFSSTVARARQDR